MNEIIISIISTHTLTWSVTCDEICIQHQNLYFNSHAHVERDVIIVSLPLKYLNFNSHAHVERDASWINKIVAKFDFNSHAHVERDICLAYFSFEKIYFNSHAHVERDFIKKLSDEITKISTHTLTWSVTQEQGYEAQLTPISTHTLTWSVTLDVVYIWCLLNVMRTYFFI